MQADLRLIERRAKDEATGEVLSLANKMTGTKMGDRYLRTKPNKSEEKRAKRAKRDEAQQNFKTGRGATLLSDSLTEVAGVYYRYIQERKFAELKWKTDRKVNILVAQPRPQQLKVWLG